jgi:hypothetical protein
MLHGKKKLKLVALYEHDQMAIVFNEFVSLLDLQGFEVISKKAAGKIASIGDRY